MPSTGRLVLMSGTPHQGNEARFKNILRLLSDDSKSVSGAAGRVIFRTKDRVRDWRGAPLFPAREIRQPTLVSLGTSYERWYVGIGALYDAEGANGVKARAAGWAKGQALQWAASSVQAGIGFLVRLAMRRLGWSLGHQPLTRAIAALRPYRGGAGNEPLEQLFERLSRQVGVRTTEEEPLDDEEVDEEEWKPDAEHLASLLDEGVRLVGTDASHAKWDAVCGLIDAAGDEKVVLFAQPVETVTVVAGILERRYGQKPALIIGNQKDEERMAEVTRFQSDGGPRFLVSSRAGGEGLNMQRARRLIHLDVPWNPMDMEQRIGRIHRFGSRKTVIVDTVVAKGSREVDMYRVARDKLALISQHLDPDQFESLFSRVMSLVPPKELETVLSDVTGAVGLDDPAIQQIGRLVTEGFRSWSSFDEAYRKQAEQIRATEPGEAHWADVGHFLVKHCGADDGEAATFGTFTFHENEIVAVEEAVPTIHFAGRTFGRQASLFEAPFESLPLRAAVDFYRHDKGWANRLIAGDSLQVMNSLLVKEGMAGQVQMIYIDPPYGIKYGSNFQPFVGKREVSDGKDVDLTQEPEMIKAFRDTWELGIHSYLSYLRDRLLLAHSLLSETGSIFVQISDENLHHVREVLDEVFGESNFISLITFSKTTGTTGDYLAGTADYLLFYAKNKGAAKYRQLYNSKELGGEGSSMYFNVELPNRQRRRMTLAERGDSSTLPINARPFRLSDITSPRVRDGRTGFFEINLGGVEFLPRKGEWKTHPEGISRLIRAGRLVSCPADT